MDCENKTITSYCLQQIGLGRTTESGYDIALGIILTAFIVAGVSVAIHIALHIWFYKPRITQSHGGKPIDDEGHHYEDISNEDRNQELKEVSVSLKSNKAYFCRAIKNK